MRMRNTITRHTFKPSMWMALSYVQQRGIVDMEWYTSPKGYQLLKVRFRDELKKEQAA